MTLTYGLQYGVALATVGLTLLGLHASMRWIAARNAVTRRARLIELIETAPLSAHAQVHVLRAGSRRVLVASARDRVTYLCDIDAFAPGED